MSPATKKRTKTYSDILTELRANRDAWRKLDLSISRSRFDDYERALVNLQKISENRSLAVGITPEEVSYSYRMLPEVYEFNKVSASLLTSQAAQLGDRIKKIFSGPELQDAEKDGGSAASRNTLFELMVASFIQDCGLVPDITGISDVVTTFEGRKFIIECKRPRTRKAVRDRISDAVNQLKKRFGEEKGDNVGIIAISCSRVFTGGNKMASSVPHDQVMEALSNAQSALASEMKNAWENSGVVDAVLYDSLVVGSDKVPEIHGFVTVDGSLSSPQAVQQSVENFFKLIGSKMLTFD